MEDMVVYVVITVGTYPDLIGKEHTLTTVKGVYFNEEYAQAIARSCEKEPNIDAWVEEHTVEG